MTVREPAVAGRFYPGTPEGCLREIQAFSRLAAPADVPERPVGGIVPHAGWAFSGATAMKVLEAIRLRRRPAVLVLLGACHYPVGRSAVFASGRWETPLGPVEVDETLARAVLDRAGPLAEENPDAHTSEHSIEVQVPLVRHALPEARIVPVLVPPDGRAAALGRAVGEAVRDSGADAVCLGSSDLTHYGPAYGFTPVGFGAQAMRWMRDQNDRRMIDLMLRLDAEKAVAEAEAHANACGAGAVAAALAAARVLGAERGRLIEYTTSYDVMREHMGRTDASAAVGYAGVVFG